MRKSRRHRRSYQQYVESSSEANNFFPVLIIMLEYHPSKSLFIYTSVQNFDNHGFINFDIYTNIHGKHST